MCPLLHKELRKTLSLFLKIISRACVATTLILSGLIICINAPFVTSALCNLTSDVEHSQYTKEQLVRAGELTRDFSVGAIDQTALGNALEQIGVSSSALSEDMLSHLRDCTPIFTFITYLFILLAIISLCLFIVTSIISSRRSAALILRHSAIIAIVLFLILIAWIIIDFRGLFILMHKVLFSQGNWTFDASSLLICMYPTKFWIAMGVMWVAVSLVLSAILLALSLHLNR